MNKMRAAIKIEHFMYVIERTFFNFTNKSTTILNKKICQLIEDYIN